MSTTVPRTSAPAFERQRERSAAHLASRIPEHLERATWSADQVAAHQRRELAPALAHAAEHSPFHARRLAGIDPDGIDPADPESMSRLPVMTKADLVADFDDVVTDRRLTRAGIEAHVASLVDVPLMHLDEYVCLVSGGSSGVRGLFAWHWTTCTEHLLGMVRRSIAAMLAAGGPPPGGVPMAMVAGSRPVHATAALTTLFSGDVMRVTCLPASLPVADLVTALHELQPALLQGYPPVLTALARERAEGRLRIAPRSVTSTSEVLDEAVAARLAEAFGVPVTDQFGSSEGLVGSSAPGSPWIELADDLSVVELVDADDRPVPPGVPSHSVLVTSLVNRAQPLIRYRLEDSMVALPPGTGSGHLLVRVAGRRDQDLRYGPVTVAGAALRAVLAATPGVVEYQVRQTAGGLDVVLVPPADGPGPDVPDLAARLAAVLTSAGLDGAAVHVALAATVPADLLSGKARRVVPL